MTMPDIETSSAIERATFYTSLLRRIGDSEGGHAAGLCNPHCTSAYEGAVALHASGSVDDPAANAALETELGKAGNSLRALKKARVDELEQARAADRLTANIDAAVEQLNAMAAAIDAADPWTKITPKHRQFAQTMGLDLTTLSTAELATFAEATLD